MIALLANKWVGYGLAVLLVVAGICGLYAYIDHRGYQRAAIVYQAKIDTLVADYATAKAAEIERQSAANNAAKSREDAAIAADDLKAQEISNLRKELADAASKDPDAGKPVLGASSVRRINKIH